MPISLFPRRAGVEFSKSAVNMLDDSVSCPPPAQKSLPVLTDCISASPVRESCIAASGEGRGGTAGSAHPEDWKYSLVGTESTAAPSSPQCATRSACGGASAARERRKARGPAAAYCGECARA